MRNFLCFLFSLLMMASCQMRYRHISKVRVMAQMPGTDRQHKSSELPFKAQLNEPFYPDTLARQMQYPESEDIIQETPKKANVGESGRVYESSHSYQEEKTFTRSPAVEDPFDDEGPPWLTWAFIIFSALNVITLVSFIILTVSGSFGAAALISPALFLGGLVLVLFITSFFIYRWLIRREFKAEKDPEHYDAKTSGMALGLALCSGAFLLVASWYALIPLLLGMLIYTLCFRTL